MWLTIVLVCMVGYFVNGMVFYVDRWLDYLPSYMNKFKFSARLAIFTPFGVLVWAVVWMIVKPFYDLFGGAK